MRNTKHGVINLAEVIETAPAIPKTKSFVREVVETLVLTAIIFMSVNFITGRFKIYGASMDTTFQNGQYIIVNRLSYQFSKVERGDVIVLVPPGTAPSNFFERLIGLPGETDFIKRLVGVPGDTIRIEGNTLMVNGKPVQEPYIHEPMRSFAPQTWNLKDDEYFVLGDNRNFSKDSRDPSIGPIKFDRIVGKVWIVYWPFDQAKIVEHYRYP